MCEWTQQRCHFGRKVFFSHLTVLGWLQPVNFCEPTTAQAGTGHCQDLKVYSTSRWSVFGRRQHLGAEFDAGYVEITAERPRLAASGELPFRSADRAVHVPKPGQKVVMCLQGLTVPL